MTPLATPPWEPAPSVARRARRVARSGLVALALAAAALATPTMVLRAQPQPASGGRAVRMLSLDEAITVAGRQSESVRVAEAGVLRARGQFYQARSQALPQVNATGSYQKQLQSQFKALAGSAPAPDPNAPPAPVALCSPYIPTGATPEQRAAALAQSQSCAQADGFGSITRVFANPNTIVLGLSGSQALFNGGRIVAGVRAAEAGRRSADIGVTAARTQATLDVAQAYFDAVLTDRLVAISESSLVQTERAFRQTAIGREVGNVSEFDLLRAQVSRDNQRPLLIQARGAARRRLPAPPPAARPAARRAARADDRRSPRAALGDRRASRAPQAAGRRARRRRPAGPRARRGATRVATGQRHATPRFAHRDRRPGRGARRRSRACAARSTAPSRPPTRAARARASARQTRENVTAQRNLLRVARAQRLPSLQLSTNYQRFAYPRATASRCRRRSTSSSQLDRSLGVSVPILTGGRIRGDQLIAQANLREAEQSARQVEELAALDARLAITQLEQAEAALRRARARRAGDARLRHRRGALPRGHRDPGRAGRRATPAAAGGGERGDRRARPRGRPAAARPPARPAALGGRRRRPAPPRRESRGRARPTPPRSNHDSRRRRAEPRARAAVSRRAPSAGALHEHDEHPRAWRAHPVLRAGARDARHGRGLRRRRRGRAGRRERGAHRRHHRTGERRRRDARPHPERTGDLRLAAAGAPGDHPRGGGGHGRLRAGRAGTGVSRGQALARIETSGLAEQSISARSAVASAELNYRDGAAQRGALRPAPRRGRHRRARCGVGALGRRVRARAAVGRARAAGARAAGSSATRRPGAVRRHRRVSASANAATSSRPARRCTPSSTPPACSSRASCPPISSRRSAWARRCGSPSPAIPSRTFTRPHHARRARRRSRDAAGAASSRRSRTPATAGRWAVRRGPRRESRPREGLMVPADAVDQRGVRPASCA